MQQTVCCPGCQSHLTLPPIATERTVQCPRCAQVFDPRNRPSHGRAAAEQLPVGVAAPIEYADDDSATSDSRIINPGPFRGERHAIVAMVFLILSVLSCGLHCYADVETMQVAELGIELGLGGRHGGFFMGVPKLGRARIVEFEMREENAQTLSSIANVLQFLLFWPTTVCFLAWLIRMSSNNRWILQTDGLFFTPGWALVTFLVPIANFVFPYLIVQELWRASHPRAIGDPNAWRLTPRSLLVCFWWPLCPIGFFLVYCGLGSDSIRFQLVFDEQLIDARYRALGNLCFVIAGLLQIAIVYKITRRQRERYIRLYEDPA